MPDGRGMFQEKLHRFPLGHPLRAPGALRQEVLSRQDVDLSSEHATSGSVLLEFHTNKALFMEMA